MDNSALGPPLPPVLSSPPLPSSITPPPSSPPVLMGEDGRIPPPPTVGQGVATVAARVRRRVDEPAEGSIVLRLGRRPFALVWLGVLLTHVVVGLFLTGVVLLYTYLGDPDLEYYLRLLSTTCGRGTLRGFSLLFGLIGAIHAREAARMLWFSIQRRRLVMAPMDYQRHLAGNTDRRRGEQKYTTMVYPTGPVRPPRQKTLVRRRRQLQNSLLRSTAASVALALNQIFGEQGIMGIRSQFFSEMQALRKLVQIIAQTYQTAQVGRLVTDEQVNYCFLAAVIFNCLSTPLILKFLHQQEGHLRVYCLACDILSGLFMAVCIPCSMFYRYWRVWDREIPGFDDKYLYDDVWFTNGVMENRLLISTDWITVWSKIYPFIECWMCLDGIKGLIKRQLVSRLRQPGNSPIGLSRADGRRTIWASVRRLRRPKPLKSQVHGVFFVLALVVSTLFGLSRLPQPSSAGCKIAIHPWFTTQYSCAVLEVNCHRQGTIGDEISTSRILSSFSSSHVISLILAHCTGLVIPHTILEMHSLLGLEIFNSSIESWTEEAAISSVNHPSIIFVAIAFTTMRAFPAGLSTFKVDSLMDIEMGFTNLTSLPSNLAEIWPSLTTLVVEHSCLEIIPPVVKELRAITTISFTNNHITEVQDDVLDHLAELVDFSIARNPVSGLPPTLGLHHPNLRVVYCQHTNTARLPEPLDNIKMLYSLQEFNIDSTPLCQDVLNKRTNLSTLVEAILSTCQAESSSSLFDDSLYPLNLVMTNRGL